MKSASYLMKADGKNAAGLADLLQRISVNSRYRPGCIYSRIWHDPETSEMMLDELWQSADFLELHITSDLYKMMLGALELCSRQPEVRFSDCENMAGIEMIGEVMEKYRKQNHMADDFS